MIRKYIIWSLMAITIGVSLSFFLLKITTISASYIKGYFFENNLNIMEEVIEHEEIPFNENNFTTEDFPVINNTLVEDNILINKIISKVNEPWGIIDGITMFRGNLTRSWYGTGPVPNNPKIFWKYPKEKMCNISFSLGKTSTWCGTGWTGQPVIWNNLNGNEEVIFGAYDGNVHFVNTKTGLDTRRPFKTGDIIKGSVTLDPNGFPLLYFGSRDNKLRIISLDTDEAVELWSLDANVLGGVWNNDWDGNPAIVNDILYEGGENGWFYAIKLNRRINNDNKVEVKPEIIFSLASYNKELIDKVGRNVSIENSLAFFDNRVYFANSGGRILGLDISKIEEGVAPIVFDFWAGDDVDSTIVIDEKGMLYVSAELERFNERSEELGQLIKLDPYKIDNPYVWGIKIPKEEFSVGGIWATPALYKNYLYVPTHTGRLIVVETNTGNILWEDKISPHAWSSPIIIDGKLIIATCDGKLKNYSLDNPHNPTLSWSFPVGLGSCIESTPIIWDGQIFVGSRDGYFYKVGQKL